MHVDEPRRDHQPGRIDTLVRPPTHKLTQRGDAAALDSQIGAKGRRSRAVDDEAALDDQVTPARRFRGLAPNFSRGHVILLHSSQKGRREMKNVTPIDRTQSRP